jgi:hypothetical protein
MTPPSVLIRPRVFVDGDQFCALYGENLQEGICGFGNTPEEALEEFDKEWVKGFEAVEPLG